MTKNTKEPKKTSSREQELFRQSTLKCRSRLVATLNKSLQELSTKKWSTEFTEVEKQRVFGLLAVIGGWQPSIRSGVQVQVNTNNQWSNAIVVDDGLGKEKLSVIYEDDEMLRIQQVSPEQVRAFQKYQMDLGGQFGSLIDKSSLFKSVISIYTQTLSELATVNSK